MKKKLNIVELQLILKTLESISQNTKNANVERACVDLIEEIYKNIRKEE